MRGKTGFIFAAAAAMLVTAAVLAENRADAATGSGPAPAKEADNTARNSQDRAGQTPTPMDQGNSKADVEMTAQIRKEVVATKSLSVNAQNVKIITNGGKVTLRGPVNTAEEKRIIGEIAARHAGPDSVDNQVEVKAANAAPDKPKGE